MLRNDLKPLLGDGWKEKFVHRDLWDPDGYGVASFDLGEDREKVLVMNLETEDIMEYFYDDRPDDEWVSLSIIEEKNYYIRKNYTIKSTKSKIIRDLKSIGKRSLSYPQINLSIKENGWAKKAFIHRLIATLFVPNPNPNEFNIVNHKDLNKTNFDKENLEWCDAKWNAKRENQTIYTVNTRYKRLNDGKIFQSSDLEKEYGFRGASSQIARSVRLETKYAGSYWEIINVVLEDYLSRHPIDPNGWYDDNGLHDFGKHKVRANVCGVLEVDGKLTVGTKNKSSNYYATSINGKGYMLHRLIYEIVSETLISDNNVIDHIIPVTRKDTNNEFQNLRECSRKENMNNPATIKNISLSGIEGSYTLSQYDLYGNHIKTAPNIEFRRLGFKSSSLEERLVNFGLTSYNSIWCVNEDSDTIKTKLSYIYYKIKRNDDGSFTQIKAAGGLFTLIKGDRTMDRRVKDYLNTGIEAPDGYYYQQGDFKNVVYDPENKELIKKREEIHFINKRKIKKNLEDY